MSEKNTGVSHDEGMTLRDYFAAKALQGLIAGSIADGSDFEPAAVPLVATSAYMFADAMLKARQA